MDEGKIMVPTEKNPFNSPFEAGIRSVVILTAAFPSAFDLQRLVVFDYLTVHSGDADGPQSLHPPVPLRSGELLVRRSLIERGLSLMQSRKLVARELLSSGISFKATEESEPFLSALSSNYLIQLRLRAAWAVEVFGSFNAEDLASRTSTLLKRWNTEFEGRQTPGELF
jgi:hypothetical protein